MKTKIILILMLCASMFNAQTVAFDQLDANNGNPKPITWSNGTKLFRLTNDYMTSISPFKEVLKFQFNASSTWNDVFTIYNTGEMAMGVGSVPPVTGPNMMLDVRGAKPFQVVNTAGNTNIPSNYNYIGRDGHPTSAHSYLYHRTTSKYQLIGSSKGGTGTVRDLGLAVGSADWEGDVKLEIAASTGNVGIGTGGYSFGIGQRLTVMNQTGDVGIRIHSVPGSSYWDLVHSIGGGIVDAQNFAIVNNNTNMFCIDPSGNTGIGVQTPVSRLEVAKTGNCDISANGLGTGASAGVWAVNPGTSFGLWTDQINEGHIAQNIQSPQKIINFKWNSSLSEPQVWIGSKKQGSGTHTNFRLAVDGKLVAKEIVVLQSNWADFVFDEEYSLMDLKKVEEYYLLNKHLPEVPSLAEISENGNNLGNTDAMLLRKIEELTLYIVDQKKEIEELKAKMGAIENASKR
jgi:hypothetical protein